MRSSSDKESSNTCQFGSIKIKVYALTINPNPNEEPTREFTSKWESKLDVDENDPAILKRLQSKVGSTIIQKRYRTGPRKWDRGEEIERMEIKYCSTPGLIIKGILPQLPKIEPEDDIEDQSDGDCKRRKVSIEPQIIRHSAQDKDGKVFKEMTMVMFDLTKESSEDEIDDGTDES